MTGEPSQPRSNGRMWRIAINAVVSIALLFLVSRFVKDTNALKNAFAAISPGHILLATAIFTTGLAAGALRWSLLLQAYGGHLPAKRVASLYAEGFALNALLPGAVVGDVVRSIGARDAFPEASTTTAIALTFIERILGLVALLVLALVSLLLSPIATAVLSPSAAVASTLVVIAGTAFVLVAIAVMPRYAPRLRSPVKEFLERLPKLARPSLLALCFVLSFATQLGSAFASFVLLRALAPTFAFVNALCTFTLANAAAFFPLTLGGLGAREGATVGLLRIFDVPAEHAVAVSLVAWCIQIVVAVVLIIPRISAKFRRDTP